MVDAEDGGLGERPAEHGVELLGGGQVPAERLLDHDPRPAVEPGGGQTLDDGREQRRRDGQVVHRPLGAGGGQALGQRRERLGVAVVAADHGQPPGELLKGGRVDVVDRTPDRIGRVLVQLGVSPLRDGHAHDGKL